MTGAEAVAQVKLMLGFRKTLDATILTQLNIEQDKLETEASLPWFLRRNSTTIHTNPGSPFIDKPADFIREWDEDPLYFLYTDQGNDYRVNLVKDSESYLTARYSGSLVPAGYAELGNQWKLIPTPSIDFRINYSYYAHAADIVADATTNPWLIHNPEVVIGRAGLIIATGLRDKVGMEVFGALAAAGTEKIISVTAAQDEAGARRVIGGED